jgi:hypothetical protein
MKVATPERRLSLRHKITTPLRIRVWKSAGPEQRRESVNLSERGILFATDSPMPIGTVVEVLLKMREEITGEPTTEWLCSGHVVRVDPINSPKGSLGVGVQFDCCRKSRNLEPDLMPLRQPAKPDALPAAALDARASARK